MSRVGRPRKASNVLELTGRFKTNPDRKKARENEPQPTQGVTTSAPKWMTVEQKRAYREIVKTCHQDVLSQADSVWVEITACLLSEYRGAPQKMNTSKLARLMACLGQLGMTPADRSKAGRIARKKENMFERFIA